VLDLAVDAGLYQTTRTWSANVGDVNADGQPDILLVRHGEDRSQLFVNEGGRFVEVLRGNFARRDRHDCAWGDVNVDGRNDLYCSVGGDGGGGVGKKELWIQQQSGPFVNRAYTFGVQDPYGRGRRSTFIDVNHDPYPDLFAGNAYPRSDGRRSTNRLWINQGGTSFRDAPEFGLDAEVGSLCAYAVDYDRDGWEDLLVCGQTALRLYRNLGGSQFVDVTTAAGISGFAKSAYLVDLDGDAHVDLVRVHSSAVGVQIWSGGSFQPYVIVRSGLAAGRWVTAGDADGDGDQDLFVVQSCSSDGGTEHPDLLLLNDGTGTSFAKVGFPQNTQPCGDNAEPVDHDGDGRTDFLVLNGVGHTSEPKGPIQLISFVSATEVTISGASFSPSNVSTPRGAQTHWINEDSAPHSVADASGMGLFDSGDVPPGGDYSLRLTASGAYSYLCSLDPSMTGVVEVPLGVAPAVGTTSTGFTVQWASAAPPSGFATDVDVKAPGAESWTTWQDDSTASSATFTPSSGTGQYLFRARLQQAGGGPASGYSPTVSIVVT
jgi:plastocyanin